MEIPSKDICAQVYFPQEKYLSKYYHRGKLGSPQISAQKDDRVSFSLLFLCAPRKTHRQTVSASAINLLCQKRKKRTLAETLKVDSVVKKYEGGYCPSLRWNVNKCASDVVHHNQFKAGPSLIGRFPSKVSYHLAGAACDSVVPCHESCCTSLDGFQLLDI